MQPNNPNTNNIGPITRRLMDRDSSLQYHNESEWSKNPDGQYSAFNDAGVESEVGEFLYGLVRVLKPGWVLETGTHQGIGGSYLGSGLIDNNYGMLDTVELNPDNARIAADRFSKVGISDRVALHVQPVEMFDPGNKLYQLILLDTEPNLRFHELTRFMRNLAPGGYVFIHDLHRGMSQGNVNTDHPEMKSWPFGDLPNEIVSWVQDWQLMPMHFPTPRGFMGFYKRHSDDFVW